MGSQRTTHLMRLTNCGEHQFLSACSGSKEQFQRLKSDVSSLKKGPKTLDPVGRKVVGINPIDLTLRKLSKLDKICILIWINL